MDIAPEKPLPFLALNARGFVRVAVATPLVSPAGPSENASRIIDLFQSAAQDGAGFVLFSELGLSGYSSEDLFFQDVLLEGVTHALGEIAASSAETGAIQALGAAERAQDRFGGIPFTARRLVRSQRRFRSLVARRASAKRPLAHLRWIKAASAGPADSPNGSGPQGATNRRSDGMKINGPTGLIPPGDRP